MKTFRQLREDMNRARGSVEGDIVLTREEFIDFLKWQSGSHVRIIERKNDLVLKFLNMVKKTMAVDARSRIRPGGYLGQRHKKTGV